jgi:Plasmid replication region DNA-binding N-term
MGRKAYFTESEVFEAADRLAAEGKEVSATALLDRLGGGSLTSVYKYLRAWLDDRPAQMQSPQAIDLPEQVKVAFSSAWRVAAAEAAKDVQAIKEKAAEEVRATQKQFAEALEQIERLEKESEAEATRTEALTARLSDLESALQEAEKESAAAKAALDQLRQLADAQQAQLEKRDSELEMTRSQKEAAMREAAENKGRLQELEKQNNDLLSRLTSHKPQKT